jgi:hypothetical protein
MEPKIALFSENGLRGKVPLDFPNMRTEFAWMYALDMTHHPLGSTLDGAKYDLGIIILPKTNIDKLMQQDHIGYLKLHCKKLAIMQEGPSWFFQDLPLPEQLWFFGVMTEVDFILAHNDRDKQYYKGLLEKPVYINPTLMITEQLTIPDADRSGVLIGGNLVRWYGGFNSLMVAQEFDEPITAPKMGRMHPSETQLDINHLPYLQWTEWIQTVNKFKYAVHLIPNELAGTFSLNCAYLGIPCIGNIHSNTQRNCFPNLSIEPTDINRAKQLAQRLKTDTDFYNDCVIDAKLGYVKYNVENYGKHMKDIFIREGIL